MITQTFASSLPALLRFRNSDKTVMYRRILGCQGAPHLHAVPDSARETAELDWSVCPFDLIDNPYMRAAQTLDRLAKVAPLSGWPDRYVAWITKGVMDLRASRGEV